MNVEETTKEKVIHLPAEAQEEVLEIVEQIEERYHPRTNGNAEHPLTLLGRIRIEGLLSDFASRHDYYSHGKLED